MKKLRLYQIDSFTDKLFSGNPAAVCFLEEWISDDLMQKIAMENNLSETAFVVSSGSVFEIRWFTPVTEVDLCGHATLAAAFALFRNENFSNDEVDFMSRKHGRLAVRHDDRWIELDFPSDVLSEAKPPAGLIEAIGRPPEACLKGRTDYLLVYKDQETIQLIEPDYYRLKEVNARGVIVTAPGNDVDFVSRFFAPAAGIDEDPVTGSAHTTLCPYWSFRLNKNELSALQLSARGGSLRCVHQGERVKISGKCKLYLTGDLYI